MNVRVLVCGGRDYGEIVPGKSQDAAEDERRLVLNTLYKLHDASPISLLVEGGADGADRHAGRWADVNEVDHLRVPAKWKHRGRAAGPTRNARMLWYLEMGRFEKTLVVAFPGGKGTADMVRQAKANGYEVLEPASPPPATQEPAK